MSMMFASAFLAEAFRWLSFLVLHEIPYTRARKVILSPSDLSKVQYLMGCVDTGMRRSSKGLPMPNAAALQVRTQTYMVFENRVCEPAGTV